ncbi:hydroxysteroid dehydrogenase-like protein 2 isoform X3 [Brevipalpus obovatus]
MLNTGKLAGRTAFITGASRGIGKVIALKLAKDGCNVAIAAKTADPHPKLEGTIYTAAKEVEAAGGKCLPLQVDIRNEDQVKDAIEKTVNQFGNLDIVINNASAINLTGTEDTEMKRYDLMHSINTRGTFMVSKYAIPHLKRSNHAHILNLSPPLVMNPIWFRPHVAYTMAKYGMSMCVLGMAHEFKEDKIAVNALWPRTAVWTAAINMLGVIAVHSNIKVCSLIILQSYPGKLSIPPLKCPRERKRANKKKLDPELQEASRERKRPEKITGKVGPSNQRSR